MDKQKVLQKLNDARFKLTQFSRNCEPSDLSGLLTQRRVCDASVVNRQADIVRKMIEEAMEELEK